MRCTTCSPTPPTPAPTSSAAPASAAQRRRRRARCGCAAASCRKANGRCSSPTIIAGSSTGTPSRPTRSRIRSQHPPQGPRAGHRRGARGLRAAAGPGHLRHLRAQTRRLLRRPGQDHARLLLHRHRKAGRGQRHPAPARRRRRRSTPRSPRRSWPRCSRPRCRPAWPPPSSWKTATTPRSRSGAARSSRPAMRPVAPSAATAPSTRTTGWSPAAWRPSGTPRCKPSPTPRPNSPAAKPPDRKP